jgi:hypothetical protein
MSRIKSLFIFHHRAHRAHRETYITNIFTSLLFIFSLRSLRSLWLLTQSHIFLLHLTIFSPQSAQRSQRYSKQKLIFIYFLTLRSPCRACRRGRFSVVNLLTTARTTLIPCRRQAVWPPWKLDIDFRRASQ